jgi:PleD family two-component response regulator
VRNTAGDMAMVLYRLNQIERKVDLVIDDHETRLRKAEDSLARLQERLTVVTAGLVALNVVASSVAAWLGSLTR